MLLVITKNGKPHEIFNADFYYSEFIMGPKIQDGIGGTLRYYTCIVRDCDNKEVARYQDDLLNDYESYEWASLTGDID